MKSDLSNFLLIDGWNVIWKIPEIARLIPDQLPVARERFNLLIKDFFYGKKIKYQIIYDGRSDIFQADSSVKGSMVRFSRSPQKADHLIISILRKQKIPGQWTVITSDRELAHKVKAQASRTVSSEDFIARLHKREKKVTSQAEKKDDSLSADEMKFWLDKFKRR
jgi:predicted RNA-binding protein with PIN domain